MVSFLSLNHRYRPEIPEPAPSLSRHGAQIRVCRSEHEGNKHETPHIVWRLWTHFVSACLVGKNPKTPNLSSMADDAITRGGIGVLGSRFYICGLNFLSLWEWMWRNFSNLRPVFSLQENKHTMTCYNIISIFSKLDKVGWTLPFCCLFHGLAQIISLMSLNHNDTVWSVICAKHNLWHGIKNKSSWTSNCVQYLYPAILYSLFARSALCGENLKLRVE